MVRIVFFLGSEGESFQVTDDVRRFIVFLTFGYYSMEGKITLSLTFEENFCEGNSELWAEPVWIKRWESANLDISYPQTFA